jgi:hypothetical protein
MVAASQGRREIQECRMAGAVPRAEHGDNSRVHRGARAAGAAMTKFIQEAQNGGDQAETHGNQKYDKGVHPSESCRRSMHTNCSGFHRSNHGMRDKCTCACHKIKES